MDQDISRVDKLKNVENWSVWKFKVRVILKAYQCWNVIEGTCTKPKPLESGASTEAKKRYDDLLKAYNKSDATAQRIIVTTVEEQPTLHIIDCETAKDMWDTLVNVYERKSQASIHLLQEQWFTLAKDECDDIATHAAKIEALAHRLDLMGEKVGDSMVMTKILLTLPPYLDYFPSAWESTPESERTKTNLISRLVAEELRHNKRDENALAAKAFFKKNKNTKQKNWKPGKCHKCHQQGHWARDCPAKKHKDDDEGQSSSQGQALIVQAFAALQDAPSRVDEWYKDSGASSHMTYHKDWFVTYKSFQDNAAVRIGDGRFLKAHGSGNINVYAYNGYEWQMCHLSNVLYVPNLKYNLFSSTSALDKDLNLFSNKHICRYVKDGKPVVIGERKGSLFVMKFQVIESSESSCFEQALVASTDALIDWHEKLAHQNYQHVKKVLNNFDIKVKDKSEPFCDACAIGKAHRLPFPHSESKTTRIGEIIHADLCGPMHVKSLKGSKYFLLLKDDFSRFRTAYFITYKSSVYSCLEDYIKKIEKHCPNGIKILRTDNGLEFANQQVSELLQKFGIQHQRTVIYTPEQNGAAERENRTLVEAARAVLAAKGMKKEFWAEAINFATYVLNYTGTSSEKHLTPYQVWYNKTPDLHSLHVFGEKVYVHIPKQQRKKLDDKSKSGVFIGYAENIKGYRIWYPDSNKIEIARDVIFTKIVEPVKEKQNDNYVFYPSVGADNDLLDEDNENSAVEVDDHSYPEVDVDSPIQKDDHFHDAAENTALDEVCTGTSEGDNNPEAEIEDNLKEKEISKKEENEQSENNLPGREGLRDRSMIKRPNRFSDFISHMFVAQETEPNSFYEAINGPNASEWRNAMESEINSLKQNKVWELVDAPKNQTIVDSRWVFKVKTDANDNIQRYKARLVAKGFTQKEGIDYKETFSPVVRFESLRAVLAIAANEKLLLKQFDVKTAFLNGILEETVYMRQPQGFSDGTQKVCKLLGSLYGLKQSSRCWNQRFTTFLKKHNLEPTKADPCIFVSKNPNERLILGIYVDDGIVAAKTDELINNLLEDLQREFEITHDDGGMFLGLQIERLSNGSFFLHQSSYAMKIIQRFHMEDANAVTIPADPHDELNTEAHEIEQMKITQAPYREAIGSLMYLVNGTRPDLAFAVNRASRYMEKPYKIHWNAVKRIIKYLKGTIGFGLLFESCPDARLKVFSDSDHAGDSSTRRSTTGYLISIGNSAIIWNSQLQKAVTISTAEAEYIAASESVRDIVWIKRLISEVCFGKQIKTTLHMDNQAAIQMIKNPVFHKRTKHVDVRYHYIRERYEQKDFDLVYISTDQQVADIFTKPLLRKRFEYHRKKICHIQKEQ